MRRHFANIYSKLRMFALNITVLINIPSVAVNRLHSPAIIKRLKTRLQNVLFCIIIVFCRGGPMCPPAGDDRLFSRNRHFINHNRFGRTHGSAPTIIFRKSPNEIFSRQRLTKRKPSPEGKVAQCLISLFPKSHGMVPMKVGKLQI